jgi:hypothetical protein
MELHGEEGMPQHELQALRHVPLTVERTLRVIPHVGALEEPADNLVQHEDADDRAVLDPADKEALDPGLFQALDPFVERLGIGRWRDPATMDRAARLISRDHHCLIPPGRLTQVDTFADFESVSEIRFRHVAPSFAKPP